MFYRLYVERALELLPNLHWRYDNFLRHLRKTLGTLKNRFFPIPKKNIDFNPKKSFIGYPTVELLRFYIDTLGIYSIKYKTQGFRNIEFPNIFKTLKIYLDATGFLRSIILYYMQIVEPLYQKKIAMFVEGRSKGCMVNDNLRKRVAYISMIYFEPIFKKFAIFKEF